jgi:phosphatidylserine/phosphatidylglycerophosphate/cardiolipin synthase-like enzyme
MSLTAVPVPPSGSYPVRPGNRVRPLVDAAPAFRRIAEAVEAAQHSLSVTFTFLIPDCRMPDGRGSLFDLLDRAAARGVDVRVLFWRPNPESAGYGRTFPGSTADRALLEQRGSRFAARWDRADGRFCQHQKIWVIDAGLPGEIAFVGGINPSNDAICEPGHQGGEGEKHDLYVELAGPSATDVHHNFVQRWNEASERDLPDGSWGTRGCEQLCFPTRTSPARGTSRVQIQRMMPAGRWHDCHATPDGQPFPIAEGESSILDQYRLAIGAARRTIYIENQALPIPLVADWIDAALQRGVAVVLLVPAEPEAWVRAARRAGGSPVLERTEALGRHPGFTLAGIAGRNPAGGRSAVYVHAKIMLVDDAWATIGSCNLHGSSLGGHSELNASIWDPDVVRALRRTLFLEHLGEETAHLEDRAALALYREIASENGRRPHEAWRGLAVALDPERYGAS